MRTCRGHVDCDSPCDQAPCFRCGWNCRNSNWTLEAAIEMHTLTWRSSVHTELESELARLRRAEVVDRLQIQRGGCGPVPVQGAVGVETENLDNAEPPNNARRTGPENPTAPTGPSRAPRGPEMVQL